MAEKTKASVSWGILLTLALAIAGGLTAFTKVQVHAEDPAKHVTREHLQHEYVPRQELDHRLDAQDKALDQIQGTLDQIQREMRSR
jgi:uncharacterized protein HemX